MKHDQEWNSSLIQSTAHPAVRIVIFFPNKVILQNILQICFIINRLVHNYILRDRQEGAIRRNGPKQGLEIFASKNWQCTKHFYSRSQFLSSFLRCRLAQKVKQNLRTTSWMKWKCWSVITTTRRRLRLRARMAVPGSCYPSPASGVRSVNGQRLLLTLG